MVYAPVERGDLSFRVEGDSLGEIEVPSDRYWGAVTARCLERFKFGAERMPLEVIRAIALVKEVAAETNAELGQLSEDKARLIVVAAKEVEAGLLDDHFPLPVWQTGSGTQTHMNVNEVIANRAIELAGGVLGSKEPIHPNDHVNMGQSSNDVFPSAMHIAAVAAARDRLLPAVELLRRAFERKAEELSSIVKVGRTHLMDAAPLTLGQELGGYAHQLSQGRAGLEGALEGLYELPLGGTAVGTGLNAHAELAPRAIEKIAQRTGAPFVPATNRFAAQAAHDAIVQFSGALRTLAGALTKIANDIRLLASGPRAGIGELTLPAHEPGSSIMPGKVNPTQAEVVTMIAAQVMGNDVAIGIGGAGGHLELNAYKPLLIRNLLSSISLLADGCRSFAENCISGLEARRKNIGEQVRSNLMLVTALNPHLGYERSAEIAHKALDDGISLAAAAIELGYLSSEQADELLRPEKLVGGG